jgi:iron complex outermembrane receptor protein
MKVPFTPIAAAVLLLGASAQAQQAAAPAQIVVTGVRAALESSLNQKKTTDSVVEVITAEDVGKMPDKNIADSLQRVPGVTISSASASEGGFDENDRVSLRGTNPSLTQTMVNGHMIGSGDWFVLNQVGTVGRSISYSLLPSELVSRIVVRKSSQADLVEGGVAGTVDIQTRKPLDLARGLTAAASVGLVHADLPGNTDPQLSAFLGWKNNDGTVGFLVQAFSQKRHLRRDGIETLGYSTIKAGSKIALSNPDLAGVAYPNAIGSALFEQTRERSGGLLTVQLKPNKDVKLDITGFTSKMDAWNYNRNYLVWPSRILSQGEGQAPDAGYTVRSGTLVGATFSNKGTAADKKQYVIVDQILRPGANSSTDFLNLDASFRASDKLNLTAKLGSSKGKGETPTQAVFEGDVFNTGAAYRLNGTGNAPDSSLPSGNAAVFTGTTLDWIFGASPARTKDKEDWAQLDAEYALDRAAVTTLKFGLRSAKHARDTTWIAQGPKWSADPFNVANLPAWNGQTYPSDFGAGLGGNFLRNVWQIDAKVLEAWGDKFSNRDPLERQYFPGEFAMSEKNLAGYLMANLEGKGWSGNVGLRVVQSKVHVLTNVAISSCAPLATCSVAGAITTSAFGSFYRNPVDNTHRDVLPSLNLKWDLSRQLVARFALARTLARPDFSALGGAVSLDDTNLTGNGGNSNLKPIRSTNVDAALEWYYAPRAAFTAGLFHMDLSSYVSFGVSDAVYFNEQLKAFRTYRVSSPVNSKGRVTGFELGWQQPIGANFGAQANYTFADGEETGGKELVGNSRNTWNMAGYFENDRVNARVAYNFRSTFFNGLDRASAQHQVGNGSLSVTVGWKLSPKLTLAVEGRNLNNPTLKYYADNPDQPTAFYKNGRQYYLTLSGKL